MRNKLNQGLVLATIIMAWALITLWAPANPLKTVLSSIFLLIIPGHLVSRLINRGNRAGDFWAGLAYAVAFSALYLMLIGLAMSVLLPLIGLAAPLTTVPLVIAIAITTMVLGATTLWRRNTIVPAAPQLPRTMGAWLAAAVGTLLPLLSIGGAITLNNGGSNSLALCLLSLTAVYTLWLTWTKRTDIHRLYPYALFMMSAGLLLAVSMRGWYITGHDIIQEYQVFQLTAAHGVWNMSFLRDAYNACLSITILPTILSRLTGLADPYIYKLLFQLMFALVPVVLYLTLVRFLPRRAAFLAAIVFVSFPTFLTDMTMLGRQEVAFLFFTLALMTLFETRLVRRTKSVLVLFLGLGMILSHYSTSYVAMGIIVTAKLLELGVLRWDRWRQRRPAPRIISVPLSWAVALALVLTVYLWNSQITSTSTSIASTIAGIATSLPKIFDHSAQTGEASYSLVSKSLTQDQLFQQYTTTVTHARDLPAGSYYPATITDNYPVQRVSEQVDQPTSLGQQLIKFHLPLYNLYDLTRGAYAKLIQLLIVLGLIALTFRPQIAKLPRQYLLLGYASLSMIALQVLLPSGIINYGLLRLIQQSLIFLAPAIVLACYAIFGWLRFSPNWRIRATAMLFVGFFLVNAGALPALTGGYKPTLATANNGLYYEAYYTHASELAGYQWLAANAPTGAIVNADEFARRKMITYAGIYARSSLAPAAIAQDAYVYLSYGNTTFGRVPFYYNGDLLYEAPPTGFLDANKNLLYSNGQVEIYK